MPNSSRLLRKSYAMSRMGKAIQRAIAAVSNGEKTQAARWASAWGSVIGIPTVPAYGRSAAFADVAADPSADPSDESATPHAAPGSREFANKDGGYLPVEGVNTNCGSPDASR